MCSSSTSPQEHAAPSTTLDVAATDEHGAVRIVQCRWYRRNHTHRHSDERAGFDQLYRYGVLVAFGLSAGVYVGLTRLRVAEPADATEGAAAPPERGRASGDG